ncbi:MAG: hypothetical protein ACLFPI_08325 [Desulfobacterales bacterium]
MDRCEECEYLGNVVSHGESVDKKGKSRIAQAVRDFYEKAALISAWPVYSGRISARLRKPQKRKFLLTSFNRMD